MQGIGVFEQGAGGRIGLIAGAFFGDEAELFHAALHGAVRGVFDAHESGILPARGGLYVILLNRESSIRLRTRELQLPATARNREPRAAT